MKFPFNANAPSYDAEAIHATIQRALVSAGLDTSSGPMHDVTETIRGALASAGLGGVVKSAGTSDSVIDVEARVIDGVEGKIDTSNSPSTRAASSASGTFDTHQFSNRAGSRSYKLYVPPRSNDAPRAMVVMLHGCTQSAADFAAGTQMNRLADAHGLLVVYPEQSASANSSRCWNWFKPQDQRRDAGEPSIIAGIVREVAQAHGVDPRRIFVAGLSAGAAMAVVLGETYPELFAGVGAHSGLAYGSAHDVASAMAAMKGGRSGLPGLKDLPGAGAGVATKASHAVPTIVFHGDRDHTVQQTNGADIVDQARKAHFDAAIILNASTRSGKVAGGRSYSCTALADGEGQVRVESWTLNGAGHAWSGGDARGSYTDSKGPDASAEMLRFFMALPRTA